RQVFTDDKKVSQKELNNLVKILWITPLMDKVFTDGPISSRKLIDKLTSVFYENHKNELSDLNKLFKQRNYLIKYGIKKESPLDAIDTQISNLSVSIASSRHLFITKLNKILEKRDLFPSITITLSGFIEDKIIAQIPATLIEEEYKNYLKEKRLADDLLENVNKTKISIFNNKLNMPAHVVSTGQQKIMLFSIILSCCYMIKDIKGYGPLLLLDEVVAHLDDAHKKQLFFELNSLDIQVFLTGVFKQDFDFLNDFNVSFVQCF
ncbi:MAG: hypothetical protein LBR35_01895, partial [Rickettsiales bacterium]|nr:hypothetical protein [Rickettsiales bacterium]